VASPGERIGSYKIVDALGAGGMGEVYRAHDSRLGRDVALKVLREEARFEPERRVRFEREARAAAGLSHPNIVSVFDIGEYDGCLYIVSELIAGDTLLSLLRDGPLATRKLLEIGVQIADGTQFALTVEPGKLSVVGTGGQASPVRIAGYDGFMPDWSPDGRWIAASAAATTGSSCRRMGSGRLLSLRFTPPVSGFRKTDGACTGSGRTRASPCSFILRWRIRTRSTMFGKSIPF